MFFDPWTSSLAPRDSIEVAEDGYWGLKCKEGHRAPRVLPPRWHRDRYECEVPHERPVHEFEPLVLHDAIGFLDHSQDVLKAHWFHSTTSLGGLTTTHEGLTHLGSSEAADDRGLFLTRNDVAPATHRVRIASSARVHPFVLIEPTMGDHGHSHFEEWFQSADVIRYVNAHEAPGSISLAVKPQVLVTSLT